MMLSIFKGLGVEEVVDMRTEDEKLLFAAVENGNIKEVADLIALGVNVNAQDACGRSILREAILMLVCGKKNAEAIVWMFLSKEAAPEDKFSKNSILHTVVDLGKTETGLIASCLLILKNLLAKGASTTVLDIDGNTPLHIAVGRSIEEFVDILLESKDAKQAVNIKNENEQYPLHLAAGNGNPKVVKQLIAAEADMEAKNTNGLTPYFVARLVLRSPAHVECAELLEKAGAKKDLSADKSINQLLITANPKEEKYPFTKTTIEDLRFAAGRLNVNAMRDLLATLTEHEAKEILQKRVFGRLLLSSVAHLQQVDDSATKLLELVIEAHKKYGVDLNLPDECEKTPLKNLVDHIRYYYPGYVPSELLTRVKLLGHEIGYASLDESDQALVLKVIYVAPHSAQQTLSMR